MSSTDLRTLASWMAREQDVVVLPTPPLPPTKIQRRVFWLTMFSSVGARSSASASTVADILMVVLEGFSKIKVLVEYS